MTSEEFKKLIMGSEEAALKWDVSQDHVKRLAREGKCIATLIGRTWVIFRDQPNPTKKKGREKNDGTDN